MKYLVVFMLVFSLVVPCTFTLFIPTASANPIVIMTSNYEAGGLFFGENVSMPESIVNIVLDPIDSETFELQSSFTLTSEVSQTVLSGFAYPRGWLSHMETKDSQNCEFEITLDQSVVPFVDMNYNQLINVYNETAGPFSSEDLDQWDWMIDHNLVVYNISFIEDIPQILEVNAMSSFKFGNTFRYCVGSAYSWSGETHETITLEAKGIADRRIREGSSVDEWSFGGFYPETGLSESWNFTWAKAVWDFTLDNNESMITHVGYSGSLINYWEPLAPVIDLVAIVAIAAGSIILLVVLVRRVAAH